MNKYKERRKIKSELKERKKKERKKMYECKERKKKNSEFKE